METVTVEQLLQVCKQEVAAGNGKKAILISNDDEGNGYHHLLYHFTKDVKGNIEASAGGYVSAEVDKYPEKFIILG